MKAPAPITEQQLRVALRAHLLARGVSGVLIEEMTLESGASRIDLAVLGPRLSGFEIKSDLDSPARFVNQIHAYNRVFDEIHLVCSKKACKLFEAIIPSWWGIFSAHACERTGSIELDLYRAATLNDRREAMSLAVLLRRDEALAAYDRHIGYAPPRSNKSTLHSQLAATLSLAELSALVVEAVSSRRSNSLAV